MGYRKLSDKEIYRIHRDISSGVEVKTQIKEAYLKFAKEFYSPDAVKLRFEVNSEYNDSTYDNAITYVAVLNDEGEELQPKKGFEKKARMAGLCLPFGRDRQETNELLEDFTEIIPSEHFKLPELYVKED